MNDKIRLLIMEDNNLLRKGFVDIFEHQQTLEVDVCSGDADDLDHAIQRFNPHQILINSHLISTYGLEIVQHLIKKYPHLKIVLMGISVSGSELIEFMDAGVSGFILKDAIPQDFLRAIKAVAKGDSVIPDRSTNLLLSHIVELAINKGDIDLKESVQISKFELKLLQLINEGLNDNDIGEILGITPESVKIHIHRVKLNLSLFSLIGFVNNFTVNSQPQDDDFKRIFNN